MSESAKRAILTEISPNGCGHIILNRPKKYNALSFKMLEYLLETLLDWRDNPNIKYILFTSNCKKAFCAGGDIEELSESIINPIKQKYYAWQFIYVEYRLDLLIATYSKPIISFIDGYIMGGGCGISINSKYNIITENAICAMPECSIYWFPDCLFSYYLHSNMSHSFGTYIGLTGAFLDYKDILYCNLVKYFIKTSEINTVKRILLSENVTDVETLLNKYVSVNKQKGKIEQFKDVIHDCFGQNKLNLIINRLEYTMGNNNDENIRKWAKDLYNKLLNTSPVSLKVTMKLVRERKYNINIVQHALSAYNIGVRMLDKYNFHNGVKKWRAEKNKQMFDERFPYDLKHNHESSELLDDGMLDVFLELDARYSCKLEYNEYSHILSMVDVKINDRPAGLKIDDIVNVKLHAKL
eukprot:149552_1